MFLKGERLGVSPPCKSAAVHGGLTPSRSQMIETLKASSGQSYYGFFEIQYKFSYEMFAGHRHYCAVFSIILR